MHKIFILTLLVLSFQFSFSQKKKLTLEEAVLKQRTTLAPERLAQIQWAKNGNQFAYIKKVDGKEYLILDEEGKNDNEQKYTIADFNKILKANAIDTFTRFPLIEKISNNNFQVTIKNKIYALSIANNSINIINEYPETAEAIDLQAQTNCLAYVNEDNLFIKNPQNNAIQITTDGSKNIVYGKSVHRDEYGISKGTYWSNSGQYLAFYRMDQSMVADYPILDLNDKPAKSHTIKYPMAGATSHQVKVGVFNLQTNKTVYLDISGPVDQYLTNIAWSPNDSFVFVIILNRKTTQSNLNMYNARTGSFIKILYQEINPDWVEPLHPIEFLKNNPSQFIYQSQKSGHNHLYLMNLDNDEVKPITQGSWDVLDILNIDNEFVYYTANISSPLDVQFCKTNLYSYTTSQLTSEKGLHSIYYNEISGSYIDSYSNINTPRNITVFNKRNRATQLLLQAQNPLQNYDMGILKIGKLVNKVGFDLYYRMILPPDFDSTKKYKSITYVYNGPHVQLINNSWLAAADMWQYYMAQEGYIVFTLDGRGSGNRGFEFEKGIHRQLGTCEIEDQLLGNKFLRSLNYIDTNKMGVHGWSFGGFMTTSLMTRTPNTYQVGVAGGPVIDWGYYETMYTERYMDTPDENPVGYKTSNLLNYVDNLNGKLLLIHGTSDDVVVWQHSLLYLKKCIESGKQVDYFVYPGHLHNVLGKDRLHLMQKITDYFNLHL